MIEEINYLYPNANFDSYGAPCTDNSVIRKLMNTQTLEQGVSERLTDPNTGEIRECHDLTKIRSFIIRLEEATETSPAKIYQVLGTDIYFSS